MPTYEYVCVACGTHVDVFQRFSEEALSECGICGGRLRKVFHPAGILFRGPGFYATDSRAGKSRTAARTESGAGAVGESAEPATTGETKTGGGVNKKETPTSDGATKKDAAKKEASGE